MEILEEKYIEEKDKEHLIQILAISAILDILTTSGSFAAFLPSLGGSLVVEEIIENFVSRIIAKYGGIKLTTFDNTVGALPIPGITAVTVHCTRKLLGKKLK